MSPHEIANGATVARNTHVAATLLHHARYEIIPTASIEEKVLASVPKTVTVTITASPTKGLDASLELSERLRAQGYRVVPHLSARLVGDRAHLEDIVARLVSCGVEDVFVPAGDADPPLGRYDSALPLLRELDELGRPFRDVGITGYPESHPSISDDLTVQAMWDKRNYATYIVSNLCFNAATVRHWIGRVRDRGVVLPIYFGLAGPVEQAKLLRMATKIGVGDSIRVLAKHSNWFIRMGTPGGYDPARLLARAGSTLSDERSNVKGLHVFTFNQLQETEEWRYSLLSTDPHTLAPTSSTS
jgi:methylenetetrahydrofolate reductase (NADPH)